MRVKESQRPASLKRRIGYHDEYVDEEEDLPDATRMKVNDMASQ